jgi:hypothetical protein
MRAVRTVGILAILLLAACVSACGDDEAGSQPPRSTAHGATTSQVSDTAAAWRIRMDTASRLSDTNAWETIQRSGEVVARGGQAKGYAAVVLDEWLDRHGVALSPPLRLRSVLERVADQQELTLMVFGTEHRRAGATLTKLHPSRRELRSFYRDFTGEDSQDAGDAMLEWLGVFRKAIRNTDSHHVVVVPLLD